MGALAIEIERAGPEPPHLNMRDGAAAIHRTLDRIDADDLPDGQASAVVQELTRARSRIEALTLRAVAAANRAQVAGSAGRTGTGVWLAKVTNTDEAAAVRDASLANALDNGLDLTQAALGSGELTKDHAAVIADAVKKLPPQTSPRDRQLIEQSLVGQAKMVDPGRLRKQARRALAAAKEKTAAEVDAHEDQLLRTEEERALRRCRLTMYDNGDGTTDGRFTVPTPAASILRKALQQLAAPRRNNLGGGGRAGAAGSGLRNAAGGGTGGAGVVGGSGAQPLGKADAQALGRTDAQPMGKADAQPKGKADAQPMSKAAAELAALDAAREAARFAGHGNSDGMDWPHRYGLALLDVLEHLPTDRLHGKVAATVVVTVAHDALRAGVGAAHLDTGEDISVSQLRRLACEAGILPAVLGGQSQVLDLGRAQRLFNEAQRTALATRYDECAAEGCDRPFAWSELHHEDPWSKGGKTNLDLAVPLCGFHHRKVHDPGFVHQIKTISGRKVVLLKRRT